VEGNEVKAFGDDPFSMPVDARGHPNFITRIARGAGNGQAMRAEIPIFGDDEQQFGFHRLEEALFAFQFRIKPGPQRIKNGNKGSKA
jgi:hypothetical protein